MAIKHFVYLIRLILLILLFFAILPESTFSQLSNQIQHPSLGVQVCFSDFKHIDGQRSFSGISNLKTGISINYLQGLTSKKDINVTIAGSIIDFTSRKQINYGQGNKSLFLESDISFRRKFLLRGSFFPFMQIGVGGSVYKEYWGAFLPAGVGAQLNISKRTFILLNAQYRLPISSTQDSHLYYAVGISGVIGKSKGSKVKLNRIEALLKSEPVDTDKDGIVDSLDKCVTIPGIVAYKGCPVPDTDGDGIRDDQDSCIHMPGVWRYSGCPIPDRDGDKVSDELDQCPDAFGMVENSGCPVNKDSIAKKIDDAARNIFFITGSYEIDSSSFRALGEVIKLLRDNPIFKLDIKGHTDNEGSEASNQLLSEQRAKAVYDYLNEKGIPRFRLQSFGYGQTRPVANNRTTEGRALNRRVEMKLKE